MAWTDGSTKSTGDVITAAIWNGYLGAAGSIDKTAPAVVTTAGDIVYATGDNAIARLAVGATHGHVLTVSGSDLPAWEAVPAGGAWTLEAATTTEYSTTSTSNATLVTIASLNIAASKPLVVATRWNSNGDGVAGVRSGGVLQLNGGDWNSTLTIIGNPDYSGVDEAYQWEFIPSREADYSDGGFALMGGNFSGSTTFTNTSGRPKDGGSTEWDTEALASFSIGARTSNTNITIKLKGVYLWSLATS